MKEDDKNVIRRLEIHLVPSFVKRLDDSVIFGLSLYFLLNFIGCQNDEAHFGKTNQQKWSIAFTYQYIISTYA